MNCINGQWINRNPNVVLLLPLKTTAYAKPNIVATQVGYEMNRAFLWSAPPLIFTAKIINWGPPSWSFVSTSAPCRSLLTFLKFYVTQLRQWPFRKCSWKLVSLWGSLCTTTSKSMMTSAAVLPSRRSWAHNAAGFGATGDIWVEKVVLVLLFQAALGLLYLLDDTQRVTQAQQIFIIEFGPYLLFGLKSFHLWNSRVLKWIRCVLQLAPMFSTNSNEFCKAAKILKGWRTVKFILSHWMLALRFN